MKTSPKYKKEEQLILDGINSYHNLLESEGFSHIPNIRNHAEDFFSNYFNVQEIIIVITIEKKKTRFLLTFKNYTQNGFYVIFEDDLPIKYRLTRLEQIEDYLKRTGCN